MNDSIPRLRETDGFGGRGDDFYEALLEAHQGLSVTESSALNSRLILLLANHIGDVDVIRQALSAARASLIPGRTS